MDVRSSAPSARIWVIAALEIAAALMLARLIVWADRPPMTGMHHSTVSEIVWTWPVYVIGALATAAVIWWALRRQAVAAVVGAVMVTLFCASAPLRGLAAQSHFIAMVALELLMVLVPLMIVTALPRPSTARSAQGLRSGWVWLAVASAVLYPLVLIIIHLPAAHHSLAETGAAPLWLAVVAPLIGTAYWFGVLGTAGVVPVKIRWTALVGAQEVAAFIGLLSVFGAWTAMTHASPWRLSASWDQRLGGIFMMATCAAVAVPISRKLLSGSADAAHVS